MNIHEVTTFHNFYPTPGTIPTEILGVLRVHFSNYTFISQEINALRDSYNCNSIMWVRQQEDEFHQK